MRNTLSIQLTSLLIQYSLVISVTILPFCNPAIVRAQEKVLPANGPTTSLQNDATHGLGPTASREDKRTKTSYLDQTLGRKAGFSEVPNLAEKVMGFAGSKTPNDVFKLFADNSSAEDFELDQDPIRPLPVPPPPGIGSGGTGPGGSFNVEPPGRLQGPPGGVRSTSEVLNEVLTAPRIPNAIPSTASYCWPGDPACRKRPVVQPRTALPKPTPPPRPQSWSVVQPELLVANNGAYIEKLMTSALPYLSHLWSVDVPVHPAHLLAASSKALLGLTSPAKGRPESVSASSVWADCTNVEGHAVDAQLTVYIYVDAVQVGTTSVQGGSYFIYDISAHVNDGGYHDISAWYYDSNWNWLEAGSTSVSGCFPNYDFDTPRLEPFNHTGDRGVNPGSQNINWNVPLVGLPGRGLDLDLLLTYNSLVWTKSADGAAIMYDTDHGFPSPGFRLRFPILQPTFFNPQVGVSSYMLVTSTGARIELRQVSSNTYEATDSSYIKMVHQGV